MSNRNDLKGQKPSIGRMSERRSTNQNGVVQPLLTGKISDQFQSIFSISIDSGDPMYLLQLISHWAHFLA